ncbi:MAG: 50S ribosomal protein L27 [Patescibacteria group bacterium]|nr:50S ribosomal protein L27 [Patescibacteria group bacterium]MDE2144914.1 50S ribosomal protein L27 [Patescibacteria group bacterium]
MAHTKAGGSTKLGRDSESKRLGVKISDGQKVNAGQIIIRQRGSKYSAGGNVRRGGDDTLYAALNGKVKFSAKSKTRFDGTRKKMVVVSVTS